MSDILQENEAAKLVEPYLPIFRVCYDNALNKFNSMLNQNPEPMFLRTKATLLHNLVANEVKTYFSNDTGIRVLERYESLSLIIKGRISARFKKLNQQGFPSNVRTRRNEGIVQQQLQLRLPFVDAPEITCVDVGYVINATWTNFAALKVLCRIGDQVLWSFPINLDDSAGTHQIPVANPVVPAPTERVKIKQTSKENKEAS